MGVAGLLGALHPGMRVLLSGPVGPDGDSVGACLVLQRWLAMRGVTAAVAGAIPPRYRFLPGATDIIGDGAVTPDYDAVVILDGDRHRLAGQVHEAFARAEVKGIVDHHASTNPDGYTHYWVEADAVSTCEMLYDAMKASGVALDAELAALLYAGSVFDTGGFRYSNTTPHTLRMAAELIEHGIDHADISLRILMQRRMESLRLLGEVISGARSHLDGALVVGRVSLELAKRYRLRPGDLEGVVDALVHVEGVEVGCLLIERRANRVKASLRSGGEQDVGALAHRLVPSGGGHRKAAGAVVDCGLDELENRLVDEVASMLSEAPR